MNKSTLSAKNISKSYKKLKVLQKIDISIKQGEVIGFLGPNGSGKTTLFYIISGLVQPDKGQIVLDEKDITHIPMYLRGRSGIGYLPQDSSIFRGMNVENNIDCILELFERNKSNRKAKLEKILSLFKIDHIRKQPATALSGGERRRVEIARAVAANPKFLLLDEPFAGIDPIAVSNLKSIIKDLTTQNIGILITDHNVKETLGVVDRAYILYQGKVLISGDANTVTNYELAKDVYLGNSFD